MIPVSALVGLPGFEPTTITVERQAAPTDTDDLGAPIVAAATEVELVAVVHPMDGKTMERAGLDAARDAIAVYTTAELRTATDGRADIVQWDGERWLVQKVADYGTLGGLWISYAQRFE